jgi:hypothetical protein
MIRHKPIDGKPAEVRITDAREIRRRNAGAGMGCADGQVFPIQRLDDFGRQDRLELLHIRVLVSKIVENISASTLHFQYFGFHYNVSFNLFKRL